MSARIKFVCGLLMLVSAAALTGCDEADGYGMGYAYAAAGSLAGGGAYDDGSWGNWLTGTSVTSSSDGNPAIWGDGFYCVDGECSASKTKHLAGSGPARSGK